MFLSEYQAKEILHQYGVPVPQGRIASSSAEAEARCRELDTAKFVVKAQIGAGGRGLAGGVKFAATPSAVAKAAGQMLGSRLVTEQTGAQGEKVERVYVEEAVEIAQSLYLAVVIDQAQARPTLLASAEGGEEFESKVSRDESILHKLTLNPAGKIDDAALTDFLGKIGLTGDAAAKATALAHAAIEAFFKNDVTLLEINPLAVTAKGEVLAVDAKMVIDDNALYRHPELAELAAEAPVPEVERRARDSEINYVKMSGNIGMVVNGAGLGLATNDMLIAKGGKPANFMDIRTTATSFQIANGVRLLLEDKNVRVILVNIHGGGMTTCDTVAEGISFAYSKSDRKPPIVYRAAGQNADWSYRVMADRRLPFTPVQTMSEAVAQAVQIAGGR